MKYLFLLLVCVFNFPIENSTPPSILSLFKRLKLDAKYEIKGYLRPSSATADFNGDGRPDEAILVIERKSKMKGIILLHGGSTQYFVFGAGTKFGNGGKDFSWLNGWQIYKEKTAYETCLNKDGDLTGSKKIMLQRPALYLYQIKDGTPYSGGIIYWNDKKYIWIQQGE